MRTFFGIAVDNWFDGSFGSIIGGLVAVLVAYLTARGQTRTLRYQVQRDRLDRGFAALVRELPALADRTRTYASGPRREEAIVGRKYDNLANDARRVVLEQLPLLTGRSIRKTISEVPEAFVCYAQEFKRTMSLSTLEAETKMDAMSEQVRDYIGAVMDLIQEDFQNEKGTTRSVGLPASLRPPVA
jgi:hypothetical protein